MDQRILEESLKRLEERIIRLSKAVGFCEPEEECPRCKTGVCSVALAEIEEKNREIERLRDMIAGMIHDGDKGAGRLRVAYGLPLDGRALEEQLLEAATERSREIERLRKEREKLRDALLEEAHAREEEAHVFRSQAPVVTEEEAEKIYKRFQRNHPGTSWPSAGKDPRPGVLREAIIHTLSHMTRPAPDSGRRVTARVRSDAFEAAWRVAIMDGFHNNDGNREAVEKIVDAVLRAAGITVGEGGG